ncbi:DUF6221 family protein [Streptomyces mirabilis]|uniref:DUF6221 family protein n=1 Tax=Streptomyces mirabilis TaxID=68239 RepID=UPI00368BA021
MSDELVTFLRARLDDDERIARAMNPDPVASMARKFEVDALRLRSELDSGKSDRIPYDEGQADALHWAATVLPERMPLLSPFGQSRVLREVEAKRKLVELHGPVILRGGPGAKYFDTTTVCCSCEPPQFPEHAFPCPTLRLLALPYADHPDYRSEWAP